MHIRLTSIALAIAAFPCLPAQAQAPQAPKPPAATSAIKPEPITKVEVKGSADSYDPRRDDTASKTVLNAEEIMKYGDTNVFDVLKRAPGVTVIGNSIRMRGLGNGYTQILVNGERPPPGFSMDALAPDQIEKIEVIRAATAEHSMQAIAGTVNIVLKRLVAKAQRDLRINTGRSTSGNNVMMIGTLADRTGQLSYFLNAMLSRNSDRSENLSADLFTLPDGQARQFRTKAGNGRTTQNMAGFNPRLNWKLANDDQLNVSAFMQVQRTDNDNGSLTANRIGSFGSPDYIKRQSANGDRMHFIGAEVNWVAKLAGGKLDAKLNGSTGKATNLQSSVSSTAGAFPTLLRDADNVNRFANFGSTGKYARSMFEGHSLGTGWEVSRQRNRQDSDRLEGLGGTARTRTVEEFEPTVTKLAAYVQDEWNITKNWSMYQGVRWEGIRTESEGTGLLTSRSNNHVLSPVVQTLYKFPDKSGRQLRLAFTRTFKAPGTFQLSARRFESDLNTRFNPDSSGNPDLKPELANGVDLTYEHFWFPGAVFSVSASARHIKDYMRSKLTQDSRGYWLVQPLNDGNAQVRSLDIEAKFPLKAFMQDAPPLDLRASINRNWSKVDSVPGPDNRLDQQIPLSVSLGADYRVDKFNVGASFNFREGGLVRVSEQQSTRLQLRRELEAYLLYKFRPGLQLRASISNMLGEDNLSYSRYADSNGVSESWNSTPRSARLQANLEMKF